ncbi:peptidylprolyl isomerase [Nitrosopumilus sp.]|uniref:peptidylprolyl isomerase n=1 Tax=Nitrosopumilus sp. TaxID=2024843 RepID=UPI003D0E3BAE
MNKIFLTITISILFVGLANQAIAQTDINSDSITNPVVIIETNLGKIVIGFFPTDAPKHVENFIMLAKSGFYDGTLFHRIIPGFMIQGGDPNTIDGDPNTWGTGGPDERLDAEFNNIKHNRGIVSMARSADPNSAGSQFFIVHQNSNFLDEQYTAFGRIVTEESFETLDKIASVSTGNRDEPLNPEQVRITKVSIVSQSEISNLLTLSEPERIQTNVEPPTGNQLFESEEHDIAFSAPAGWLLQQPEKTQENSPHVVAVGPKVGAINPVISLTIYPSNGKTIDDIISDKTEELKQVIESGQLNVTSQEQTTINGKDAYITNAQGLFSANGQDYNVKFKEVVILSSDNYYTFSYSNGVDDFDSQLERFDETIDSFKKLSENSTNSEENGGCLIATATFGSEMAPQVQKLRELRDNTILTTESGSTFMAGFNQLYYSFSPTIADLERESPLFKEIVKLSITPMLSTLSILNYAEINSEEEMISYGVGIILMNIGMYFAAPAIIIYKIRKLN